MTAGFGLHFFNPTPNPVLHFLRQAVYVNVEGAPIYPHMIGLAGICRLSKRIHFVPARLFSDCSSFVENDATHVVAFGTG